jgi:hypothetical protein
MSPRQRWIMLVASVASPEPDHDPGLGELDAVYPRPGTCKMRLNAVLTRTCAASLTQWFSQTGRS